MPQEKKPQANNLLSSINKLAEEIGHPQCSAILRNQNRWNQTLSWFSSPYYNLPNNWHNCVRWTAIENQKSIKTLVAILKENDCYSKASSSLITLALNFIEVADTYTSYEDLQEILNTIVELRSKKSCAQPIYDRQALDLSITYLGHLISDKSKNSAEVFTAEKTSNKDNELLLKSEDLLNIFFKDHLQFTFTNNAIRSIIKVKFDHKLQLATIILRTLQLIDTSIKNKSPTITSHKRLINSYLNDITTLVPSSNQETFEGVKLQDDIVALIEKIKQNLSPTPSLREALLPT